MYEKPVNTCCRRLKREKSISLRVDEYSTFNDTSTTQSQSGEKQIFQISVEGKTQDQALPSLYK